MEKAIVPADYAHWLAELKLRIQTAQQRSVLAVNRELVLLYWQIGREILETPEGAGLGYAGGGPPGEGSALRLPWHEGVFAAQFEVYAGIRRGVAAQEFVQVVLAQMPWYHQLALLDKLSTREEREWYAAKAIEHDWSRNVLVMQVETRLRDRQGHAVTNFTERLPAPQSDLARDNLKTPTFSTFWAGPSRRKNATSNRGWSGISLDSCSNWAPDLPL